MSKKKQTVTNAMRMLDKAKVEYEAVEYDAGGEIGDNFGQRIAALCGIEEERSFKTLVVRSKSDIIVACIPVNCELDLKCLAAAAGEKKLEMIHVKELFALTGYIRGGVSPVGMKKKYRTFIDESAVGFDRIAVSGGQCGISLLLAPDDLIRVCGAEAAKITRT